MYNDVQNLTDIEEMSLSEFNDFQAAIFQDLVTNEKALEAYRDFCIIYG